MMECSGAHGLTSWTQRRRCRPRLSAFSREVHVFFLNFKALNADEVRYFFTDFKALCDRARMISPNGPRQGILPLSPRQGWNSSLGP